MRIRGSWFLAVAACLSLASCPSPITERTFSQISDKQAPVIALTSPGNNSRYEQTVVVRGTATDEGGQLRKIAYTVDGALGRLAEGELGSESIGNDGSFTFEFATYTFSGPIALTVEAIDWNDNASAVKVDLAASGASVSSFKAVPGNKSVTLTWDPIQGAVYTLYYTDNGTLPSVEYGTIVSSISSPYTLTGVRNGGLETFLLKAQTSQGTYWSAYTATIPLSPFTLAPKIIADYRQLRIEWAEIPGSERFEVLRATSSGGPYTNYTGVITANHFIDTGVADGTTYYYKVRPALDGCIASTYNGGQTILVPPSAGQAISAVVTPSATKVKCFGSHAFAAAGSSGLLVLDVSNRTAPRLAATLPQLNGAVDLDVAADGTHVYVADKVLGLVEVDVSAPSSPIISAQTAAFNATAVSVVQGYAYALEGTGTLRCFRIDAGTPRALAPSASAFSDPAYPEIIDIAATISSDGSVESHYVYAVSDGKLLEVKVPDPMALAAVTIDKIYDPSTGYDDYLPSKIWVKPASVSGDRVYALSIASSMMEPPPDYALQIFNKWPDDASGLARLTSNEDSQNVKGNLGDLDVAGSKVFVAEGKGLRVFDISNEAAPRSAGFWDTPGKSISVASDGESAYVTSDTGFQTVDLSDPTSPKVTGSYAVSSMAAGAYRDGVVFAVAGTGSSSSLQAIDVGAPASPSTLGSLAGLSSPGAIALSGGYAFVANGGSAGLAIADVSNPNSLALVGTVPPITGNLTSVDVFGDYAFAGSSTGLQIFDISDPRHPFAVGISDTDAVGAMRGVVVRQNRAYTTEGAYFQPNVFKVIDISDPSAPLVVGRCDAGMTVAGLDICGDYAFVCDSAPGGLGMCAININPLSSTFLKASPPWCKTSSPGNTWPMSVAAIGSYAYVADAEASVGLSVIDISSPATLSDGCYRTTLPLTGATHVVVAGKTAYVADSSGLRIISLF